METKPMKPYGVIFSQKREYYLLSPQPIARDSCWNDGTYTFFVAQHAIGGEEGNYEALHIVTNSFVIEYYDNIPPIPVLGIMSEAEPITYDVLTPAEMLTIE